METVNNAIVQQLFFYILIIFTIILMVFGFFKLYIAAKQKNKWAKILLTLLTVLLVIAIIGSLLFYAYAVALGDAFKTGL